MQALFLRALRAPLFPALTPALFPALRVSLFSAAVAVLAAQPARAQTDVPAPGYQSTVASMPAPFAAVCTLPGGDLVTFDGQSVDRWTAAGAFVGNLASLPSFTFPSFVVPTPVGTAIVIGENSGGDLYLVQANGSGYAFLDNVPGNYDADWLPGGDLALSASPGFGAGNDLLRLSLSAPPAVTIGHVNGASGPLAVSAAGELVYGTVSDQFPPPSGASSVLRWSAAQVAAGNLSEANATLVAAGFDGASALAIDPVGGEVYLADTFFTTATYRVRRVGASVATSPIVVDNGADFIQGLEFVASTNPGSFDAYQPDDGVRLHYNNGLQLFTVRPKRPVLTASGPGLNGPGLVTFTLNGGVPSGKLFPTACPVGAIAPQETLHVFPTFDYVTAFTLSQTRRAGAFFALDAAGHGTWSVVNNGSLQGLFGWQFLVADGAQVFKAASNAVQF